MLYAVYRQVSATWQSRFLVLLISCGLVQLSLAEDPPLVISVIPGNAVNQVGIPLFTGVYEQLGQAVIFAEVPTARESRMIEAGNIDAVLAQIDGHQRQNPDLIQVPVPLTPHYRLCKGRADKPGRAAGAGVVTAGPAAWPDFWVVMA